MSRHVMASIGIDHGSPGQTTGENDPNKKRWMGRLKQTMDSTLDCRRSESSRHLLPCLTTHPCPVCLRPQSAGASWVVICNPIKLCDHHCKCQSPTAI